MAFEMVDLRCREMIETGKLNLDLGGDLGVRWSTWLGLFQDFVF